jgi:hypothetical protein
MNAEAFISSIQNPKLKWLPSLGRTVAADLADGVVLFFRFSNPQSEIPN